MNYIYCSLFCTDSISIDQLDNIDIIDDYAIINKLENIYTMNCSVCNLSILNSLKKKLCCMLYYSDKKLNEDIKYLNIYDNLSKQFILNYLKKKSNCNDCNTKKLNLIEEKLYCKIYCSIDITKDILYLNKLDILDEYIIKNYIMDRYPKICYNCNTKKLDLIKKKLCCMLYYSNEILNEDIKYLNNLDNLNKTIILNYLEKKSNCNNCNNKKLDLIEEKLYCKIYCSIDITKDIEYLNKLDILDKNIIKNYIINKYPKICDNCNTKNLNLIEKKIYCKIYCNIDITKDISYLNKLDILDENIIKNYIMDRYPKICDNCNTKKLDLIKKKLCCMSYYSNIILNEDIKYLNKLDILDERIILNYLEKKSNCNDCNTKKLNLIKKKLYCKIYCNTDITKDIEYLNKLDILDENIIKNYIMDKYPKICNNCNTKNLNLTEEKLYCKICCYKLLNNDDIPKVKNKLEINNIINNSKICNNHKNTYYKKIYCENICKKKLGYHDYELIENLKIDLYNKEIEDIIKEHINSIYSFNCIDCYKIKFENIKKLAFIKIANIQFDRLEFLNNIIKYYNYNIQKNIKDAIRFIKNNIFICIYDIIEENYDKRFASEKDLVDYLKDNPHKIFPLNQAKSKGLKMFLIRFKLIS